MVELGAIVHSQWRKRLARLPYAFSKKWENLNAAPATGCTPQSRSPIIGIGACGSALDYEGSDGGLIDFIEHLSVVNIFNR